MEWFADHDITVLDWPANMPDLNPIWNLWNVFKRKMRNSGSKNTDELKAQNHRLIEFGLKEPRPSVECINEDTFMNF